MLKREELHRLIDKIPDNKLPAINDLLKKIHKEDSEEISVEESLEIKKAQNRIKNGEYDTFDDVFGNLDV
jgi:hypothetical protein